MKQVKWCRGMQWLLLLLMAGNAAIGQAVVKDTSFTVYSSYTKEKKRFPQIEIPSYAVPEGVQVVKDVGYRIIGDRKLLADVYMPSGNQRSYPAVLLVFGGGWKSGNKDHWIPFAQQLAANGFVAVAVEYRLSPEAPYPAAIHDLKDAVRWMRSNARKYKINKRKIAALGASAGGHLASLVGSTNRNKAFEGETKSCLRKSRVQAVVNIDGVLAFKHPLSMEGKVAGEWLGGSYEENPTNWEAASPLNHVDKHTAPVLFLNSSTPRFHAGRDEMIKKLNALRIYSEVHDFPNTPHTFWLFHPWYNEVLSRTIAFLNKML